MLFWRAGKPRGGVAMTRRGIRIPEQEVEAYLANGWAISSEHICGAVTMLPPDGVNRVPNSTKKLTRGEGNRERVRLSYDDARHTLKRRITQDRP